MQVRRARPEEYAEIGAVTVAAYAPFTQGPRDDYVARLHDTGTRDAEAEVWVAVDEQLLGSVTLCPVGSPWREIAGPDEGEFRMLAVSPEAQGRGVGAALATHVVDRFREEGARAVVLSSLAEMTAAHRLYGRLGFVRNPVRDWQPAAHVALLAFELAL